MKKQKQEQQAVRDPDAKKQVISNRRARHEYHIVETFDAGIVLVGTEVKSIRSGRANLTDSFAKVENGEIWLHHMQVTPYEHGNRANGDPMRRRKLLLHKSEILEIADSLDRKGLTLVPLSLYIQHGFVKVNLALAQGKQLHDKRHAIAARDVERERLREMSGKE